VEPEEDQVSQEELAEEELVVFLHLLTEAMEQRAEAVAAVEQAIEEAEAQEEVVL
jgi:hypothetical protein